MLNERSTKEIAELNIDRDGYVIDPRPPTHATDEQIAEMADLFRHTQFAADVDSDYNYANTSGSFVVTFHDLTKEQVSRLADLLS